MVRFARNMRAWSAALGIALSGLGAMPASAEEACASGPVNTEVPRGTPYSLRMAELSRSLPTGTSAVVLGDSVIGRWPIDDLDQVLGTRVVRIAVGGDKLENANWMIGQIARDGGASVKVVVVAIGTANLLVDDSCAFDVKAKAFLQRLRAVFPNARIYLTNIYQKGIAGRARVPLVAAANQSFRRYAGPLRITYVDIHGAIAKRCVGQDSCDLFEPNRVHPSLAGYRVISDTLRQAMH